MTGAEKESSCICTAGVDPDSQERIEAAEVPRQAILTKSRRVVLITFEGYNRQEVAARNQFPWLVALQSVKKQFMGNISHSGKEEERGFDLQPTPG
jgi:hypothetical protein